MKQEQSAVFKKELLELKKNDSRNDSSVKEWEDKIYEISQKINKQTKKKTPLL